MKIYTFDFYLNEEQEALLERERVRLSKGNNHTLDQAATVALNLKATPGERPPFLRSVK